MAGKSRGKGKTRTVAAELEKNRRKNERATEKKGKNGELPSGGWVGEQNKNKEKESFGRGLEKQIRKKEQEKRGKEGFLGEGKIRKRKKKGKGLMAEEPGASGLKTGKRKRRGESGRNNSSEAAQAQRSGSKHSSFMARASHQLLLHLLLSRG